MGPTQLGLLHIISTFIDLGKGGILVRALTFLFNGRSLRLSVADLMSKNECYSVINVGVPRNHGLLQRFTSALPRIANIFWVTMTNRASEEATGVVLAMAASNSFTVDPHSGCN